MSKPFLIGVAGGNASGKLAVCEKIKEMLDLEKDTDTSKLVVISQESFYRDWTDEEKELAKRGLFNFDHPDRLDVKKMEKCLSDILAGRPTKVPLYDFKTSCRVPDSFTTIFPCDIILFEGILTLYFPAVREKFDLKLFINTDSDTRLIRRVFRDTEQLGRNLDQVLDTYISLVKPAFEEFCLPTKKFADVIIPRGIANTVAINIIVHEIKEIIQGKNNEIKGQQRSVGRTMSLYDERANTNPGTVH